MLDVKHYITTDGVDIFARWVDGLRDRHAAAKVLARIERLALGNFGDCESVGSGVLELRIDWGPGYRVYLARLGQTVVLLLCGGDKRNQQRDINDAKTYFADHKARAAQANRVQGGKGSHRPKRVP